jgi:hypothetical protein
MFWALLVAVEQDIAATWFAASVGWAQRPAAPC